MSQGSWCWIVVQCGSTTGRQPAGRDGRRHPGAPAGSARRSRRPRRRCRRSSPTAPPPRCWCRRRGAASTNSTRVRRAVRENKLAALACMPGAITPPMNSPFALTTSKLVAVPKSTTTAGPPKREKAASAFTTRSAPTSRGLSVSTGDAGLDARSHDHRRERERAGCHVPHRRGDVGHDARHHEARHLRSRTRYPASARNPENARASSSGVRSGWVDSRQVCSSSGPGRSPARSRCCRCRRPAARWRSPLGMVRQRRAHRRPPATTVATGCRLT